MDTHDEKQRLSSNKNNTPRYNHEEIEKKWQQVWAEKKVFSPDMDKAKKPFYNLMMFPYPSAEGLHVGNMYAQTGADVHGRFKRMQGFDVFEPIGLDGFGIHSENYALKVGTHPMDQVKKSEENFYRQMHSIGISVDWQRTVETYKPDYYKWTQWLFTEMFKAGLAYRKKEAVNWCPSCKTVLSDEQVINGECERCGSKVEKRELEQWFFRITEYAQRLLDNLETLDWTNKVKIAQKNWIGRSEGAILSFPVKGDYRVVDLHGFMADSQADFHPWLKKELEELGYSIEAPDLPNTNSPTVDEQAAYVLKHCKFSEDTVLVGHSLGTPVALKVLEKLEKPVKKTVLVAPFAQTGFLDHERPFEKTFDWKFDFEKIKSNAGEVILLRPQNDTAVPQKRSEFIQEKIGGAIINFTAEEDHATGKKEPEILKNVVVSLKAFTTRPDTLYGATFMVVSPEHPLVQNILDEKFEIRNSIFDIDEVRKYVKDAAAKTETERTEEKTKTGVFSGLYAVNPVSGEQIPVWIADYVLMGYGTGAIMAVPAHDQRDFEFAKKYDLPIKQVIEPKFITKEGDEAFREGQSVVKRNAVCVLLKNPKDGKYLCISWKEFVMNGLVTGGIEDGEDIVEAAKREIQEETGYKNIRFVRDPGITINTFFYQRQKKQNRWARFHYVEFELENEEKVEVADAEKKAHEVVWKTKEELADFFTVSEGSFIVDYLNGNESAYTGDGILTNSGDWNGWQMPQEIDKVFEYLEKKGIGKREVNFHLRDWLISRQRYWGPPIPMIFCEKCAKEGKSWFDSEEARKRFRIQDSGFKNEDKSKIMNQPETMPGWYPVPMDQLPVKLPYIDDYRPIGIRSGDSGQAGKAPLANHPEFYETTCPECGSPAKRETDVSDTFLDSAWYFLRYTSTDIDSMYFDIDRVKKWLPVNIYIGGAEHAVLHLLYARFVTMVLADLKLTDFEEPFTTFFAHGLIIKDGAKMSKSKGNVVVPDEYIGKYGADTLRMYLMFLGQFSQGGDFRDTGIEGMSRFIKRVWTLLHTISISETEDPEVLKSLHKTIKGVTEDLSKLSYNTAIAKLMEFYNGVSHRENLAKSTVENFLKLMAPFAPHLTEEIYQTKMVNDKEFHQSIHVSSWPEYKEEFLKEDTVTVVIQVNGKRRAEVTIDVADFNNQKMVEEKGYEVLGERVNKSQVKKVIYVPGKILNLVV